MAKNNQAAPKAPKAGRMTLPTKRTVNLAESGKKKSNSALAIPAIIIIVVIAAVFSKFAVVDRLVQVREAEQEVADIQVQIDMGNARIDSFGELVDIYAHYTFKGMTAEELNRIGRGKVLELIRNVILPEAYIEGFSLKGNRMTVSVTDDTLQDINLIAQKLEEEAIVGFCTVTTAATNDRTLTTRLIEEAGLVTAQLNIFLVSAQEL